MCSDFFNLESEIFYLNVCMLLLLIAKKALHRLAVNAHNLILWLQNKPTE
jgi:hypothetical protein